MGVKTPTSQQAENDFEWILYDCIQCWQAEIIENIIQMEA